MVAAPVRFNKQVEQMCATCRPSRPTKSNSSKAKAVNIVILRQAECGATLLQWNTSVHRLTPWIPCTGNTQQLHDTHSCLKPVKESNTPESTTSESYNSWTCGFVGSVRQVQGRQRGKRHPALSLNVRPAWGVSVGGSIDSDVNLRAYL